MTRILVIDAHPDPDPARFCHALADVYAESAVGAGHAVERLALSAIDIPVLSSRADWEDGEASPAIREAQAMIARAEHLVILFPLWLGDVPALLKAFLEQVFRPGFAFPTGPRKPNAGLLKGKSARIVVTMGMPALFYRWVYRAHSLKSLRSNILRFVGIGPIRETLIGNVEGSAGNRTEALALMRRLGADAA
ncbi:NAD(P)H-dependent oxidoreductase [uncultured Sphingosinicella sp.]|uniref:NAD(P)H-dependent oxidoreductase n=1 Tax=uncultured Sphingosinicella sp. TaxID=478748 RepID=UPI0030D98A05|tara:strand:- start:9161 stop:9739 length:579 start_codon:yes stop_codon:yes gene_type:complete